MKRFVFILGIFVFIGFAGGNYSNAASFDEKAFLSGDEKSQQLIFDDFLEFDELYAKRQRGESIDGRRWVLLGEQFDKYVRLIDAPGHVANKAFFLRGMLIRGECYLMASIEFYKENPRGVEFFDSYDEGIKQLREVLARADEKIDYIPRYSLLSEEKAGQSGFAIDPRAGYETIGTGVKTDLFLPDSDEIPNRDVTYKVEKYSDVAVYRLFVTRYLGELGTRGRANIAKRAYQLKEANTLLNQVLTSDQARRLLSDFCPWGVDLYFFLRDDIFIFNSMNHSILRPFAVRNHEFLSEVPLVRDVPLAMEKQLCEIIGSSRESRQQTNDPDKINWLKDRVGTVTYANGKKETIKWAVVQDRPTYTVWCMSPACYDLKMSEKISLSFKGIKVFVEGPIGFIADEFIDYLLKKYGELAGKDSQVYGLTKTLVEGNNWGVVQDEFLLERKLAPRKIISQVMVKGFQKLEEQEQEWLFENIDPKMSIMGKGYIGETIPPVIIRAEIFGYEKVPDHKYLRSRRILRYYQFDPAFLAGARQYDLRFEPAGLARAGQYKARDIKVHGGVWTLMPNLPDKPLGAREYVTDFTPKCQILDLKFKPEDFSTWRARKSRIRFWNKLKAVLYSPLDTEFRKPLISKTLEKNEVVFQIGDKRMWEKGGAGDPVPIVYDLKTEIFRDYVLRIELGKQVLHKMPVVFAGNEGRPVTGTVSQYKGQANSPVPGYVVLKIDPKEKSNIDSYTVCEVSFGIRRGYKDNHLRALEDQEVLYRFFEEKFIVKGKFDGNVFSGNISNSPDTYRQMKDYGGECTVQIDPQTMEVKTLEFDGKWIRKNLMACHLKIHGKGSIPLEKHGIKDSTFDCHLEEKDVSDFAMFRYSEDVLDDKLPFWNKTISLDALPFERFHGKRPLKAYFRVEFKP